jgi:chromosome segregation ATPase
LEKDEDFKLRLKKIIEEKEEEFENDVAELEGGLRTLKEIIASKDEEFKITVAGLEDEIKTLKKELEVGTFITDEHKKELGECKKELDRQRRKHRSEMNQLNITLEMQKSKQERLQSHIQSLEKQISDMVNEYESKLLSAYYGSVDDLREDCMIEIKNKRKPIHSIDYQK